MRKIASSFPGMSQLLNFKHFILSSAWLQRKASPLTETLRHTESFTWFAKIYSIGALGNHEVSFATFLPQNAAFHGIYTPARKVCHRIIELNPSYSPQICGHGQID